MLCRRLRKGSTVFSRFPHQESFAFVSRSVVSPVLANCAGKISETRQQSPLLSRRLNVTDFDHECDGLYEQGSTTQREVSYPFPPAWDYSGAGFSAANAGPRVNDVQATAGTGSQPSPAISHTTVMSTTAGLIWVDVEGRRILTDHQPTPQQGGLSDPNLSDAAFVIALRNTLRSYDVPETLLSEISRVVLLPVTVVSNKGVTFGSNATSKQRQPQPTPHPLSDVLVPPLASSPSPSSELMFASRDPSAFTKAGLSGKKDVCFVCRFARVDQYAEHYDAVSVLSQAKRGLEKDDSSGSGEEMKATRDTFWSNFCRPSKYLAKYLEGTHWGGGWPKRSVTTADGRTGDLAVEVRRGLQGAKGNVSVSTIPTKEGASGGLFFSPSSFGKKGGGSFSASSSLSDGVVFETIQQLSSRLTVFILPRHNMIITVHRHPIKSIRQLKLDWHRRMRKVTLDGLLRKLVVDCAQSFLDMERIRAGEVDALEERLFETAPATASHLVRIRLALFTKPTDTFKASLERLYSFSREASAYCRILQPLMRAYEEARIASQGNVKNIDLVEHRVAAAISMCEGLREQTQSLLSLQFSVGAGKLEELFRLLTVFSTIFIPLEFIASLGGAEVSFVKAIVENNELSLQIAACIFAGVFAITMLWLRRMEI